MSVGEKKGCTHQSPLLKIAGTRSKLCHLDREHNKVRDRGREKEGLLFPKVVVSIVLTEFELRWYEQFRERKNMTVITMFAGNIA